MFRATYTGMNEDISIGFSKCYLICTQSIGQNQILYNLIFMISLMIYKFIFNQIRNYSASNGQQIYYTKYIRAPWCTNSDVHCFHVINERAPLNLLRNHVS